MKKVTKKKLVPFAKKYRHAKTGKIMVAEEYGYTVWRFRPRKAA